MWCCFPSAHGHTTVQSLCSAVLFICLWCACYRKSVCDQNIKASGFVTFSRYSTTGPKGLYSALFYIHMPLKKSLWFSATILMILLLLYNYCSKVIRDFHSSWAGDKVVRIGNNISPIGTHSNKMIWAIYFQTKFWQWYIFKHCQTHTKPIMEPRILSPLSIAHKQNILLLGSPPKLCPLLRWFFSIHTHFVGSPTPNYVGITHSWKQSSWQYSFSYYACSVTQLKAMLKSRDRPHRCGSVLANPGELAFMLGYAAW